MTWAQKVTQIEHEIQREQAESLRAAGFSIRNLTESEVEDGIGLTVGLNAVKDGLWYTFNQALKTIDDNRDALSIALKTAIKTITKPGAILVDRKGESDERRKNEQLGKVLPVSRYFR